MWFLYYQVTKGSNYKIIQILEAQYKFVTNLVLLSIVCLFVGVTIPKEKELDCFVQLELFVNTIEKEKGKHTNIKYVYSIDGVSTTPDYIRYVVLNSLLNIFFENIYKHSKALFLWSLHSRKKIKPE